MKPLRVLVLLVLCVEWMLDLSGPAGRLVGLNEPAGAPAGLSSADWQALQAQLARLVAGGGEPEDWFGWSVAVGSDAVVVGAPGVDVEGRENQGAAYVFYRDQGGSGGWAPLVMLVAADGAAGDNFGYSVSIFSTVSYGNWTVVVGSPLSDVGGHADQGAAYVFRRNTGGADVWGQVAKLSASDGASGDQFGYSVSVYHYSIYAAAVVGAPFANVSGRVDQGTAYVFLPDLGGLDAWGQSVKLVADDGAAGDYFGSSISYYQGVILAGADSADIGGNPDQGAAYVIYRHSEGNWFQVAKLTAGDGAPDDSFGYSVSIYANTALVGARNADPAGSYLQGAAYVFDRNQGGDSAWGQVARLTAADGAAEDRFGWSVSLFEDTAVVGAPYAHVAGIWDRGAAYVFLRSQGGANAWGQLAKLAAAQAVSDDRTGWSVSVYAGAAVVGTGFADVGSELDQGAAYVFERDWGGADAWGQAAALAVANGLAEDRFGFSVDVDGDTAIVGAYDADVGGHAGQGAAYIFERNRGGPNAWGPVATLLALDGAAGDAFGWSVSISANYAIVGAVYADVDGYQDRGAAYLFLSLPGIPWGQGAKFVLAEGNVADYFGSSVSISGQTVVIGADSADVGAGVDQGAAFVLDMDTSGLWHWIAMLAASDGGPGDSFGYSASLSGDTVVVGARNADPGGVYLKGAAYIFERHFGDVNAWGQVAMLTASEGDAEDRFGWSVAIDGDQAIVGAPFSDVSGKSSQGAAYVYHRNQGGLNAWGQEARLTHPAGAVWDWFGWSVSVSGSMAAVGAPGVDYDSINNRGMAYLYSRAGAAWLLEGTLMAHDAAPGDSLGLSVSASAGTVIVGACFADVGPKPDQGVAYVTTVGGFWAYLPMLHK